ncbi:class I adenylate-forming enzyme family protein [Marimonas arenosa]|uniref:Acyl--CoA ligase n=1 Tax=Marimonas arenosa TaxID=1795305 RepID=A0AAE4B3X5_9RHOB|nr:class I adenylate-forming enzyme family protein [Marimonas arenosa]MDQ2089645.1 acyl--CoA ligase [Marimonas arenosa]
MHEGLLRSADKFPEKTAILAEGQPYPYAQLKRDVLNIAEYLMLKGIQRGSRCVIYMDNTYECVASVYAVLAIGGVFVLVNPQTKRDKLHYILNDCNASALLASSHLYQNFKNAADEVPPLQVVVSSGDDVPDPRVRPFSELLKPTEPDLDLPQIIPNDLAALIYTSGSTGRPKGVMHTHSTMLFALGSLIEYLRLRETDRMLVVLPLSFDYGLYHLFMCVQLGATLVLERSFAFPSAIYNRIREAKVSVFPGVPSLFSLLLSSHKRQRLEFPSVTRVTNTAAALPHQFVSELKEIFPNALIYKMYGQTECKRVCFLEPELVDEKPNSVGKAIPGTEVFIADEQGKRLGPGHSGTLYVRGPHIMLGYWNLPEETEKVLLKGDLPGERVLCTQDLFKMDDEGFLYFHGRNDDIIKSGGEKVSPTEIENVLLSIDGIKEAAVVGVDDEVLGEATKCFLVLECDAEISALQVKKACAEKLENFMVPKHVEFVEELEKTVTGKISKKNLK